MTVPALLLLISGGMVLIRRWAPPAWWPVAALAWVGLLGPLPLLAVQRVFAPTRPVQYVVFFVALLGALLFEAVVRRTRGPAYLAWLVLGAGLAGYAGYRLPRLAQEVALERALRNETIQADQWLRARRPRRVFTNAYGQSLHLRHLALARRQPQLPIQLVEQRPSIEPHDYLLLVRGRRLPDWVRPPYRLVYQHGHLVIYDLMPDQAISAGLMQSH